MVKVKLLKDFSVYKKGDEIELSSMIAADVIRQKIAKEVKPKKK